MASDIRRDCVFVRIETGADGWALQKSALEAFSGVPWLAFEAHAQGVCGVVPGEENWPGRVGEWVRALPELGEVEVREGIALLTTSAALEQLLPRLSQAEATIHGVFASGTSVRVALDPRALDSLAQVPG